MPKILRADVLGYTKGVNSLAVTKLIERAGRTCYKSDKKITEDSADGFVRGVRKLGHESVIEHSWFNFFLAKKARPDIVAQLLLANNLLTVTLRPDGILVSGNARMFRDFFKSDFWKTDLFIPGYFDLDCFGARDSKDSLIRYALIKILAGKYPVLFEDLAVNKDIKVPEWVIFNPHLKYSLREKERHWWALVKFTGGTRAFTHQLVRHRYLTAFSQESQRYCDEAGFTVTEYFSIPLSVREAAHMETKDGIALEDWFVEKLRIGDGWYQELQGYLHQAKEKGLTKGKVNEDARYLLVNAVCSEVVCSAPLGQWKHIFKMRACDRHAQWEIRNVTIKLLRRFKSIFPGVFDEFEINEKEMVAEVKKVPNK